MRSESEERSGGVAILNPALPASAKTIPEPWLGDAGFATVKAEPLEHLLSEGVMLAHASNDFVCTAWAGKAAGEAAARLGAVVRLAVEFGRFKADAS